MDRIVGVESEKRGVEAKKRDGGGGEVESLRVDAAVGSIVRDGRGERTSGFEVAFEASSEREGETGRFAGNRERKEREGETGEGKRESG